MYGKIPVFVRISRIMWKCMIKNGSAWVKNKEKQ